MSGMRILFVIGLLSVPMKLGYCDMVPTRAPLAKPPLVAPVKVVEGEPDRRFPDAVAKVMIPKSLLPELREQAGFPSTPTSTVYGGTILAGLAISAAAISLLLVLKNKPRHNAAMVWLIGGVLLSGLALAVVIFSRSRSAATGSADRPKPQPLILFVIQDEGHEVTLSLMK